MPQQLHTIHHDAVALEMTILNNVIAVLCFISCLRFARAEAEELAKAQFAAKRDPNACALMYVALGKKQLLQGQHRGCCSRTVHSSTHDIACQPLH